MDFVHFSVNNKKEYITHMNQNIAIDGPAGAGKSTIAKLLARKLDYIYVDTGAMYRAMAIYFLRQNLNPDRKQEIKEACQQVEVEIMYKDGEQQVILNKENVTHLLRTEEVGKMASAVSIYPAVREKLIELQRTLAEKTDVIMDGRDIGTYVLPDAMLKIYLTADVEIRAQRRFLELQEKGMECDLEEIKRDIEQRDYQDMHRENSPLKQAADAVCINTSQMTIEEIVEKIIDLHKKKRKQVNEGY